MVTLQISHIDWLNIFYMSLFDPIPKDYGKLILVGAVHSHKLYPNKIDNSLFVYFKFYIKINILILQNHFSYNKPF